MMTWADVFEFNLEKLRRYAAMVAGDAAMGDRVVELALEGLIAGEIPADNPSVCGAFAIVDEILRDQPLVREKTCEFGVELTCLERRLILLIEMEGLSLRDAAIITGQPFVKISEKYTSARLKCADSLP